MMYEYDTYVDARKEFPRLREPLQAAEGEWFCVKSDVLAGTMTFSSSKDAMANVTTLPVSRVREIMALNRQGKKVDRLQNADDIRPAVEEPTYRSEEDSITRFDQAKRRNKRGGRNNNNKGRGERPQQEGGGNNRQEASGEAREERQRRPQRPNNGNNGGERPRSNHPEGNNGPRAPRENNGNREGGNRSRNNRRRRGNGGNGGNGGGNTGNNGGTPQNQ